MYRSIDADFMIESNRKQSNSVDVGIGAVITLWIFAQALVANIDEIVLTNYILETESARLTSENSKCNIVRARLTYSWAESFCTKLLVSSV